MSSNRKRSAIQRHKAELDHAIMMRGHAESHAKVVESMAMSVADWNQRMEDCILHLVDEAKLTSSQYELCRQALNRG